MDMEQLKLILETLEGLGGDVRQFAMLYVALHYGVSILGWVAGVACCAIIVKGIRQLATGIGSLSMRRVGDLVGYDAGGIWGEEDTDRTILALKRKLKGE